MKAVILARGRGTRMQRNADTAALTDEQRRVAAAGLKAMMPFNGRPFLDYVLSTLADAGCADVCLVVGPEHHEVRDYYTRVRPPSRVRVTFAEQPQPRGTADAVLAIQPFAAGDPFLVVNADNLYPADVLRRLAALEGQGLPAFSRDALIRDSNIPADRVRDYAILRIDREARVADIVEKPDDATLRSMGREFFVSMNCWRLDARIYDACRQVSPSPRGELELPNAVRYAIQTLRQTFRAFEVHAGVLDLSNQSDVAAVASRLAGVEARP